MDIHVLFPCLKSAETLDFHSLSPGVWTEWTPDSQQFLQQAMSECRVKIKADLTLSVENVCWHPTFIDSYKSTIDCVVETVKQTGRYYIIVSLVDGSEKDGWPGLSVIEYLHQNNLIYTGSSPFLYKIDQDKSKAKEELPADLTPNYCTITSSSKVSFVNNSNSSNDANMKNLIVTQIDGTQTSLVLPVLIKPSFTSGSVGISDRSVIANESDISNISFSDDYYVEEYIEGREFTCFIIGNQDMGTRCLNPAERVFHTDLPATKQFLSFDRKWNGWLTEWWYEPLKDDKIRRLIHETAKKIFEHVKADGYCRMDMRMRGDKVYVVDFNTNPSLDGQDDTALGHIIKSTQMESGDFMNMKDLVELIFQHAVSRRRPAAAKFQTPAAVTKTAHL